MEPGEKICPRCAETVKAAAVVCRFCGHNFVHQIQRKQPDDQPLFTPNALRVLIVGLPILLLVAYFAPNRRYEPATTTPAPVAAPSLTGEQRKGCGDAISKQMLAGLVKARPSPNRVNVDEVRWARLSATDKQALLAIVLCDMAGKHPSEMTIDDQTVAYGFRSGKRLAMLTMVGMSYE